MNASQGTVFRPKNSGQKRIFDNPVLERLSRTHIAIPISLFVGIAIGLAWYAFTYTELPPLTIGVTFLVGLFVFSFVEYVMHRYLFHMSTHTPLRERIQYNFHGVHHEYPKDKGRLAMPPIVSIAIAAALLGLFYLVIGEYAFAFHPGFLLGYAAYLFVHFAVHAYPPPKNAFKVLWVNHGIHHYKDHNRAFGVSSPFWDYVFRTLP